MNAQEAADIKAKYNEYDEEFRRCKKAGYHKQASEWKARRDALAGKLNEAIKVLQSK